MKSIKIIITLCLMFGLINTNINSVYAEDGSFTYTVTNDPKNMTSHVSDITYPTKKRLKASQSTEPITPMEGVAQLRQTMVNREATTSFVCDLDTDTLDNLEADLQLFANEMFYVALAHTGVSDEGDYLRWQFDEYKSSISYTIYQMDNYYVIRANFIYDLSYYTTSEQEVALTDQLNNIISGLNIDDKSAYEKISKIYDYVTHNVTYDYAHLNNQSYTMQYTAYAAVFDGTAVCQGYALLIYRMMLMAGIDARLIAGDANYERHGWNIVKIGDYYYNVDSTWDASYVEAGRDYRYFLRCMDFFDWDHKRDSEYNTTDFHASYPMYGADYGSTNKINPNVTLSKSIYTYDGKVKKPSVTVKNNSKKLLPMYYKTTYQYECKNVGSYSVKVKLKTGYSGSKTVYFKIIPVKTNFTSLKGGKKSITLKWTKKTKQTTGYEIQYATNKKMTKNKVTKIIKSNNTSKKTYKKLKRKTKYYVRIRTYKTVKSKKYYSKWSSVKNVTTK